MTSVCGAYSCPQGLLRGRFGAFWPRVAVDFHFHGMLRRRHALFLRNQGLGFWPPRAVFARAADNETLIFYALCVLIFCAVGRGVRRGAILGVKKIRLSWKWRQRAWRCVYRVSHVPDGLRRGGIPAAHSSGQSPAGHSSSAVGHAAVWAPGKAPLLRSLPARVGRNVCAGLCPERVRRDELRLYVADFPLRVFPLRLTWAAGPVEFTRNMKNQKN